MMTLSNLSSLSPEALSSVVEKLEAEKERRQSRARLGSYRPYRKQRDFHAAGRLYRERLLMAGNQLGKTFCGGAEVAMHLTGRYPDWWPGLRFTRPVRAWAGSQTAEVTRDGVQRVLIGEPKNEDDWGTGLIPHDTLADWSRRQGIPDAIDSVLIRHASGGLSTLGFKSYDQGRAKWQGETLDLVWLDEEPPLDLYTEALTRTNAVAGVVVMTFTPLLGMSETVARFLGETGDGADVGDTTGSQEKGTPPTPPTPSPPTHGPGAPPAGSVGSPSPIFPPETSPENRGPEGVGGQKSAATSGPRKLGYAGGALRGLHVTSMTIEDAEHYTPEQRAEIIASYPRHERDARARGIPTLGSGRVFPVSDDDLVVEPFKVPEHWPQINGLDFGWDHPFAAVNLAWDRDADVIYVCKEYAAREQTPIMHAAAVKPWGEWIPCSWPHDGLQHEKGAGEELALQYQRQGLLMLPERATFEDGGSSVEAGIMEMLDRMQTGRWKVFSTCAGYLSEVRLYHRKNGIIVKLKDDRISASRYAMMMLRRAETKPRPKRDVRPAAVGSGSWMG